MPYYSIFVRATTNSAANTEDTAIDIDAAANQVVKLVRLRIVCQTAALDNQFRGKICRKSASGSGGVAGTEVLLDPVNLAAQAATTIKTGTTAFGAGTITDTIDDAIQFNSRGTYEWVARDEDEKIKSAAGGIIGINIFNSAASIAFAMYAVWEE